MTRWSTVPFVLIVSLILLVACGGEETASLPPTQPALLAPTTTAEPDATGPAFVDDLGAGIVAAASVEIERQSRQLLAALDAGGYVAGEANLRREYSPEAGLMFAEIVGGTIEQVDASGQVVASYAPGTRVMESQIPGNAGELLFFSPEGVNYVRSVAGLPPINPEAMVFRLTAEGIPYVIDTNGNVISRVMATSNPDVAPWMPEEILAIAPDARVIRPITEGTSGPMGAYDETAQNLLAQQDENGNWVSYSAVVEEPTPMPALGQVNEENQWWDGAGWQGLPEGEGWQVSVSEDGTVKARDVNGAEYTWVDGQWVEVVPEVAVGTLQQAEGGVQIMTEAGWQEVQSLNIDHAENLTAEQLDNGEIVFYYTINGKRIGFGKYENGKYVQEPIGITGRTAPEIGDPFDVVDALQLLEATSKTKGNFAVTPGVAGDVTEITYAIYNPDGEEAWQDPRFQQWLDAAPGLTMPAVQYVPQEFVGMPVADAGAKVIMDTLNFAKGVSEDGKLYFPMGGDARTRTLSEYQSLPIEAVNPEKVVLLWAAHENPLNPEDVGVLGGYHDFGSTENGRFPNNRGMIYFNEQDQTLYIVTMTNQGRLGRFFDDPYAYFDGPDAEWEGRGMAYTHLMSLLVNTGSLVSLKDLTHTRSDAFPDASYYKYLYYYSIGWGLKR